jgi:hypothetical protein
MKTREYIKVFMENISLTTTTFFKQRQKDRVRSLVTNYGRFIDKAGLKDLA